MFEGSGLLSCDFQQAVPDLSNEHNSFVFKVQAAILLELPYSEDKVVMLSCKQSKTLRLSHPRRLNAVNKESGKVYFKRQPTYLQLQFI